MMKHFLLTLMLVSLHTNAWQITPTSIKQNQITELVFLSDDQALYSAKDGNLYSWSLADDKPELIAKIAVNTRSEMGLLSFALNQQQNKIWLHYNPKKGDKRSRISQFDFDKNKLSNEQVVIEIDQPFANHNGGAIRIDSNDNLYIGMGDGGAANDPFNNAQDPNSLLGKILRINVSNLPYAIPKTNPFVNDAKYRGEIWAMGLRNPWKFSLLGNQLIIADVGQNKIEEVSIASIGDNLGWRCKEGNQVFNGSAKCDSQTLLDPVAQYNHDLGQSITGGFVYSGPIEALDNHYIFGDFVSGRLWSLNIETKKMEILLKANHMWSTMAQSPKGEVYVVDFNRGIFSLAQ